MAASPSDSQLQASSLKHPKRALRPTSPSPSSFSSYSNPSTCEAIPRSRPTTIRLLPSRFSPTDAAFSRQSSLGPTPTSSTGTSTTSVAASSSMDQFETEALEAFSATLTTYARAEQDLCHRHLQKLQSLRASHRNQLQTLFLDHGETRKRLLHDTIIAAAATREEKEEGEVWEQEQRKAAKERVEQLEEELDLQREKYGWLKEEFRKLQASLSLFHGQHLQRQQQQLMQGGYRGGYRGEYRGRGRGRFQYRWRGRLSRQHPYQPYYQQQSQQQQIQFGFVNDALQLDDPPGPGLNPHHFESELDDLPAQDRLRQRQNQPQYSEHLQGQEEEGPYSSPHHY